MPELFYPISMLFGVLGCMGLWSFSSLCWESWFAAAVSLAVLHSLYMLRTERRLLRFMDCVRSMATQRGASAQVIHE